VLLLAATSMFGAVGCTAVSPVLTCVDQTCDWLLLWLQHGDLGGSAGNGNRRREIAVPCKVRL
jgi:hypothetical protein